MSSKPIENQQIRSIDPIGGANIAFGAAVQTFNWDTVISKPTDVISIGLGELVTTVPAAAALTAVWLTNISITINGTHEVVRDMTRAEYLNVVQNLEFKEATLIDNLGESLWKSFKPALPAGTRLSVAITINTLALGVAGPPATAAARLQLKLYDAQATLGAQPGKMLHFYQRIPEYPPAPGIAANTEYQVDLGVESKTLRYVIIREFNAGALADVNYARHEFVYNGNVIAQISDSEAKKHYFALSDGIAVPVGYKAFKLPGIGWQANNATNLFLRSRAHTTSATGQLNGFQVLVKPFV